MKINDQNIKEITNFAICADKIFNEYLKKTIFNNYPKGCCRFVSDSIGYVLVENNIHNIKISINGSDINANTHSWIQIKKIIIDITCYQFDCLKSVYVGELTNWHKGFKNNLLISVEIDEIKNHWIKFIGNYEMLLSELQKCYEKSINS